MTSICSASMSMRGEIRSSSAVSTARELVEGVIEGDVADAVEA